MEQEKTKPFITIATGEQGIGKTFLSTALIKEYVKIHTDRPVIIFDVNNEYQEFDNIYFNVEEVYKARVEAKKSGHKVLTESEQNIQRHRKGIGRIVGFTLEGYPMSIEQKQLTMNTIIPNFRNGMAVLDDVNNYYLYFRSTEVYSLFMNIRHGGKDIIMHIQSLEPLEKKHIGTASVIRMHYDGFDITPMRGRLGNHYEILKISQNIINNEYLKKGNIHICVYVWIKLKKLKGITKEQFEFGCREYLMLHNTDALLKRLIQTCAREHGRTKPTHADTIEAENRWIKEKMYYID